MTPAELLAIKPGDRVWVGAYLRPRTGGVRSVAKVTRTQIAIDWNGNGKYLRRFRRCAPNAGYEIGASRWNWECITGVATEEECASWDEMQREQADAEQLRIQKERERMCMQGELSALFTGFNAHVEIDGASGLARLILSGLSQYKVREIAAKLAARP